VSDPRADVRRRYLMTKLMEARLDLIARERVEVIAKIARALSEVPAGPDPQDLLDRLELQVSFEAQQDAIDRVARGEPRDLDDLRMPSSMVLSTARALRDEGRSAEARPLLERARVDLDASGFAQRYLGGLEYQAELEAALGGTWLDDREPRKAELELAKAVDRLAALEDLMKERGGSPAAIASLRNMRCNALVSLAVNANVELRDTKKAIEWFEKAWALRQDDFMRVLLACYRARVGKSAEARALLRQVAPSLGTHYNMACTYALLGEKDAALEFLKRELEENQPTPGQLERQRAWARKDPDLESLRGDPRFEALVKKAN
jgi:tetratricopeptide (TPR) repeat protein